MNKNNLIHITNNTPEIYLQISQILLIQSDGHYAKFSLKTDEISWEILPRISLNDLENVLPSNFLRINKFQIINLNEIVYITKDKLHFKGGKSFDIKGKSTFKKLKYLDEVLCYSKL